MSTVKLRSHVGPDGMLKLEIPVDIRDADLDVEVRIERVAQVSAAQSPEELGWPPGFFEETAGAWAGGPLVREPQGNYETRKRLE